MMIRRFGCVCVVFAVAFLVAGVETAWATPPPNDTFADATKIHSLPFSDNEDTTQATSDATDAEVATACGYGGLYLTHTVWYDFTPTHDQLVWIRPSSPNYSPGVGVVIGKPGNFSAIACSPGNAAFTAHAGVTYHIDVVNFLTGTDGGTLDFSITGLGQGPVFTIDPKGQFDSTTGAATVTGSLSCPTGFSGRFINLGLSQQVGRGTVSGSASVPVNSCGTVPQQWSITIKPSNGGKFTRGDADVAATFSFFISPNDPLPICGCHGWVFNPGNQSIKLRP